MIRGPCRVPTNPWCFWPQRLPTTLNISTSKVFHSAIPSSLCILAISESSQNLVKNYSIRVSTEIPPHPEPRTLGDHNHEAYGDLQWVIGFHLSPNSACPRLSRESQLHLNFEILVLTHWLYRGWVQEGTGFGTHVGTFWWIDLLQGLGLLFIPCV